MKKKVLKSALLLTAVLSLTNLTGCKETLPSDQGTDTAKPATDKVTPSETSNSESESNVSTIDALTKRKTEALSEVEAYKDLTLYSEANRAILQSLIDQAKTDIQAATTVSAVEEILTEFKGKADLVKTVDDEKAEELAAYKVTKKTEIESYKNTEDYRDEEKATLLALIETTKTAIDAATSKEAVDTIVTEFKTQADSIKTKAVRDAEDLAAYKVTKKNEVENYVDHVNYREANEEKVLNLIDAYSDKIDTATSIAEVDSFFQEFKNLVDAIPVDSGFTGALDKGATVSFTHSEEDLVSDLLIRPTVADWSGDGFAIRIKNLSSNENSYINVYLNETDSDRVMLATGATYYLYNLTTGKKTANTSGRDFGYYINLPGNFDGYVYIPYSAMVINNNYGSGNKTFNYKSVYGLYLETNPHYDNYQNYQVGEIQTVNGEEVKTVLKTEGLTTKTYGSTYVADYNGSYIKLEFNGTDPVVEDQCPFSGSITGSEISFKTTDEDLLTAYRLIGQSIDWSGDGIAIRVKNIQSTNDDSFVSIFLNETDSDIATLKKDAPYTYYYLDGSTADGINGRGWGSYINIKKGFDGYIYLPYSSFEYSDGAGDKKMTYQSMWGCYLSTNTKYDSYQHFVIGSIEVKKGEEIRKVLDTTKLTADTVDSYIIPDTNASNSTHTFYTEK